LTRKKLGKKNTACPFDGYSGTHQPLSVQINVLVRDTPKGRARPKKIYFLQASTFKNASRHKEKRASYEKEGRNENEITPRKRHTNGLNP